MTGKATTKNRIGRAAVAATLAVAAVIGGTTTASADPTQWQVNGTFYQLSTLEASQAAAKREVPSVENRCRAQDGVVVGSGVWGAQSVISLQAGYYAYADCRSKRG